MELPHYHSNSNPVQDIALPTRPRSSETSEDAWHPKITPYRFAILLTTLLFGTAKAVVTQQGRSLVSTTLEWIVGTLLSIVFFSLSAYDSGERVPPFLIWLFRPDCMNLLWMLLESMFSFKRPAHTSNETPPSHTSRQSLPLTSYRILVCVTVTAFGLSKAVLGYRGQSTSLTWVDWAFGTPITCALYILGLYENNPRDILKTFFTVDKSASFVTANIKLISAILGLGWIAFFSQMLYLSSWNFKITHPENHTFSWKSIVDDMGFVGAVLLHKEMLIWAIVFGLFCLGVVLHSLTSNVIVSIPRAQRIVARIARHPVWNIFKLVFRIIIYLSIYLAGIVTMLTGSTLCLNFCVYLFQQPWDFISLILRLYMIFLTCLFLIVALSIGFLMVANFPWW